MWLGLVLAATLLLIWLRVATALSEIVVGADMIVIGHRKRSLLRRCMEASVAKRVLDRAPCVVLAANSAGRRRQTGESAGNW